MLFLLLLLSISDNRVIAKNSSSGPLRWRGLAEEGLSSRIFNLSDKSYRLDWASSARREGLSKKLCFNIIDAYDKSALTRSSISPSSVRQVGFFS